MGNPSTCPYSHKVRLGKYGRKAVCLRSQGPCQCGLPKGSPTGRLPVPPVPGLGLLAAMPPAPARVQLRLDFDATGKPVVRLPGPLPDGVYVAQLDYSDLELRAMAFASSQDRCRSCGVDKNFYGCFCNKRGS